MSTTGQFRAAGDALVARLDPDQRQTEACRPLFQQVTARMPSKSLTASRETRMSAAGDDARGLPRRRRMEIFAFLFLTAVLMPALAVATVGGYGLTVWVYQMM